MGFFNKTSIQPTPLTTVLSDCIKKHGIFRKHLWVKCYYDYYKGGSHYTVRNYSSYYQYSKWYSSYYKLISWLSQSSGITNLLTTTGVWQEDAGIGSQLIYTWVDQLVKK